jgi:hypothetical protein
MARVDNVRKPSRLDRSEKVTSGATMDDVISKLTAEEGLKIIERLARNGGAIEDAVANEAMSVLADIELDATADDIFAVLDAIDVTRALVHRMIVQRDALGAVSNRD